MTLPEIQFDHDACLLACARGEQQALRSLYAQESARLLGVAVRIVSDRAVAEDIVHDTFIRVWARAGSFDPAKGAARGWIYSITRHLALNHVRDRARDVELDPEQLDAQPTTAALDAFELQACSGRIRFCLEQLEAPRRACILHAYVDGYSHAQIAEKLDTPLGTVKAWIKRSLAALRECMG